MRICIIKLGAMGDVLRTTCILPGLKKKYGTINVTWVTKKESVGLLENNPYISRIITLEDAQKEANNMTYDRYNLVICLDDERDACALSSHLMTDSRFGSYMEPTGGLTYTENSALWFKTGLLGSDNKDELKKTNKETYPAILYKMLGLKGKPNRPILNLTKKELNEGKNYVKNGSQKKIGINTGAGGRWDLKKLSEIKTAKLISEVAKWNTKIWILGGPEEKARNSSIIKKSKIAKGVSTTLAVRKFASVIANLDMIITSDSLALHIALALKKPVVVFFGPTSSVEIELYGLGEKVLPDKGFKCFYTRTCPHKPNCEKYQDVNKIIMAAKRVLLSIDH